MNGLNVFIFLAALVTFESLQDVYMQGGISVEWLTKMKSGVSKITGEPFDDSMLGLFLESFVDNSFQKLDLLKVLFMPYNKTWEDVLPKKEDIKQKQPLQV